MDLMLLSLSNLLSASGRTLRWRNWEWSSADSTRLAASTWEGHCSLIKASSCLIFLKIVSARLQENSFLPVCTITPPWPTSVWKRHKSKWVSASSYRRGSNLIGLPEPKINDINWLVREPWWGRKIPRGRKIWQIWNRRDRRTQSILRNSRSWWRVSTTVWCYQRSTINRRWITTTWS